MAKRYFTKTGIELTVIQGQGLGDGIPRGDLKLVDENFVQHDLMSQDEMAQWETWISETFGDEDVS